MFVNNTFSVSSGLPPQRVQESNKQSAVENLFLDERCKLRRVIDSDPDFIAFRGLPDPLLTLLYGEKECLAMTPNTRTIHDEKGEIIGGYTSHFACSDNAYHPRVMRPFNLEGYWVPISEGQLFETDAPDGALTRIKDGVKELLFLVHPTSKDLYAPLRAKFAKRRMLVPALSLSSFRTLLIAVPMEKGGTGYEMVKLSLDEEIGGVERRLHRKECSCSVATTALLDQRSKNVDCFREDWSFVPNRGLINPEHEVALDRGAGMIHRPIPEWLADPSSIDYAIPLFALFGRKNWPLLRALIKQSGLTPTQFIRSQLLRPFAELLIDHAVFQRTSLELHGQNLLLRIRCPRDGSVEIGFAYRDMRGANTELTKKEFAALPKGLRRREYFYSESYHQDAAWVLESVSRRVCFELTKQLFKADEIDAMDPDFAEWKGNMIRLGYGGNWTVDGQDNDAHVMEHSIESFFRYGYFSKIFGDCLLEVMTREGVFLDLAEIDSKLDYGHFKKLLGDSLDPCLKINWFEHLMLSALNL